MAEPFTSGRSTTRIFLVVMLRSLRFIALATGSVTIYIWDLLNRKYTDRVVILSAWQKYRTYCSIKNIPFTYVTEGEQYLLLQINMEYLDLILKYAPLGIKLYNLRPTTHRHELVVIIDHIDSAELPVHLNSDHQLQVLLLQLLRSLWSRYHGIAIELRQIYLQDIHDLFTSQMQCK